MIFVNFKTYPQSSGKSALHLAAICEKVSNESRVPIIAVISPLDTAVIKKAITTPVWLQYMDARTAILYGISGTLLNHSEHPLSFEQIRQTIQTINLYHLSVMICAPNPDELIRFTKLQPDFLAYEPPELIGSKTASVATAYPEIIKNAVRVAGKIPIIVGAGIKSAEQGYQHANTGPDDK